MAKKSATKNWANGLNTGIRAKDWSDRVLQDWRYKTFAELSNIIIEVREQKLVKWPCSINFIICFRIDQKKN